MSRAAPQFLRLNRSRIADGLRFAFAAPSRSDVVRGRRATTQTLPVAYAAALGAQAVVTDGTTTNAFKFTPGLSAINTSAYTMFVHWYQATAPDHGILFKLGDDSTGLGMGIGADANGSWDTASADSHNYLTVLFDGVAWNFGSGITCDVGRHSAALVWGRPAAGNPNALYLDGADIMGFGNGYIAPSNEVRIGSGYTTVSRNPSGAKIAAAYVWSRSLSIGELNALRRDPWLMFRSERRLVFATASTAAPYSRGRVINRGGVGSGYLRSHVVN